MIKRSWPISDLQRVISQMTNSETFKLKSGEEKTLIQKINIKFLIRRRLEEKT